MVIQIKFVLISAHFYLFWLCFTFHTLLPLQKGFDIIKTNYFYSHCKWVINLSKVVTLHIYVMKMRSVEITLSIFKIIFNFVSYIQLYTFTIVPQLVSSLCSLWMCLERLRFWKYDLSREEQENINKFLFAGTLKIAVSVAKDRIGIISH